LRFQKAEGKRADRWGEGQKSEDRGRTGGRGRKKAIGNSKREEERGRTG